MSKGEKFKCPVCGCPSSLINQPENVVDYRRHLRRCPRCGSILRGVGRIWVVEEKGEK